MEKQHKGSCHCGAVTFTVVIDASQGTRCNCTICTKLAIVGGRGKLGTLQVDMSIFQWQDLLYLKLGRSVTMSISALWVFRAIAELVLFRIGEDGAWWRFFLFLAIAGVYLIPLARSIRLNAVTG